MWVLILGPTKEVKISRVNDLGYSYYKSERRARRRKKRMKNFRKADIEFG